MANGKIGSYSSYGETFVELIDTTGKQLVPGDSGKIFMCDLNSTADVVCFLPKLSTSIAGWNAKFVVRTVSSNDFAIVAYGSAHAGSTAGDSDKIVYHEMSDDSSKDEAADAIEFTAYASDIGTFCDIFTDGSKWYAYTRSSSSADTAPAG
jgi:hypothetical protein